MLNNEKFYETKLRRTKIAEEQAKLEKIYTDDGTGSGASCIDQEVADKGKHEYNPF